MRLALLLPCLAALAVPSTPPVHAQAPAWKPDRPVEIIVGTSPGGSIDRVARLAQKLVQDRGWVPASNVVNKQGGGGAIAYGYVAQKTGDASVLAIGSLTMLTNHVTGKGTVNYTDLTPIAQLTSESITFSVRTESAITGGRDLVSRLRQNPASASFAIASALGAANHIATGMVAKAGGADLKRLRVVVFNSSGDSLTSVLGGHVDVVASSVSTVLPHIEAGKVRMLAVAAGKRLGGRLADVPTWRELGVDAVFANWFGAFGPKGLEPAQVAYWDSVFARLVKTPEWQRELERNLWDNDYMDARASRRYLDAQYAELKTILGEFGLVR